MKKIILSLVAVTFLISSCYSNNDAQITKKQGAYYDDWDRAIRTDVDMQNMYGSTPRKIQAPIDMYMAMALAAKYNYSRRMISYEQAIVEAGKSPINKLPEVISKAGYVNTNNPSDVNSDLKSTWNLLDVSSSVYQSTDKAKKSVIAYEQSRKVIHNLLQETRNLYWKSLMAQKLLPVMDEMIEFMVLEVDQMNINAKQLAEVGDNPSTDDLMKKREYMEEVRKLSDLKRDIQTSQTRLASLMGFHPSTEFKLVGKEYGNFALPEMKRDLATLEWLALTNRPELRMHDEVSKKSQLKIAKKDFDGQDKYKNDPTKYNRIWAEKGNEVGLSIFEDIKNANRSDLIILRRQRMSSLVLSQVYVSWARYVSTVEDYQIAMEIAGISEDIAEDITYSKGIGDSKSHLESSRAILDEAKAYRSYIEVQDSLGNLYSTIGMDPMPYYMIGEKPSNMAIYLRESLEKWRKGEFIPDNRPYLLSVPSKRPPINLSSEALLPDIEIESGERVDLTIPDSVFSKMDFQGKITTKAGLVNDVPLPKWLKYNEDTRTFSGVAMPSALGLYNIKLYALDSRGSLGYLTFKITVIDVFVTSTNVRGLTKGRTATVLKKCVGAHCGDNYIETGFVGKEVEVR